MTKKNRQLVRLSVSNLPARQSQREKDRAARIEQDRILSARREMRTQLTLAISGYGITFCRSYLREHAIEFTERDHFGFTEIVAQPGVSMLFDRQGEWAHRK